MLTYLEKYSQLPESTKQRFSSPAVMSAIKELEKQYQVALGSFVIKLLVREVSNQGLTETIIREFGLSAERAQALTRDLRQNIFSIKPGIQVSDYLSYEALEHSVNQTKQVEQKTADIIAQAKINFASRELEERFKKIISTYLRGIRDRITTREALVKEVTSGGLGFDVNSAASIVNLAKDEPAVAPIKQPNSWTAPETVKPPITRDVEYDLATSLKARQAQAKPAQLELEPPVPLVLNEVEGSIVEGPVPLVLTSPEHSRGNAVEGAELREMEPIVRQPADQGTGAIIEELPISSKEEVVAQDNRPRMESGKIKMEDIQISPKIYTPVDELKYMTVKNFRNLNHDPVRATEVIKKKIEVLGQEDYGKKVAGVQGWKASPLNRMYIETYQEAINSGKPLEKILSQKKKDNPDYLTSDEFEAILAFNQEINKLIH